MTITKGKIRPLPIILGIVLIAGIVFGIKKISFMINNEDTENSYLETDIVPIAPKVQGYITKIFVKENQAVKAGDTLFILDDRDYRLRVQQAEAALANAEASLGVVQANAGAAGASVATASANVQTADASVSSIGTAVATAQSNVEAAKARAWQAGEDFKRFAALLPQKAVTQQQYDAAKSAKEQAEAALAAAQHQLETAQSQVKVSESQRLAGKSQETAVERQSQSAYKNVDLSRTVVQQRRLDLENAKLNLSYTVITAPVNGVVAKKNAQLGQLVNVGSPLCSVVSTQSLWVTANFKETQVAHMQPGQPVTVEVDAYDGRKFAGHIESIAPATGAKFSLLPPDNASGNFVKVVQRIPVRITIDNSNDPAYPLRAGMSVEVIAPVQ